MTSNLISYWRYKEDQRHNFVSEFLARDSLNETVRHNKESESISWSNLTETIRHNKAMESISQQQIGLGYANLAETVRHNQEQEKISWAQQYENQRSHKANESISQAVAAENARHNLVSEQMQQQINDHRMWLDKENLVIDAMNSIANIGTNISREWRSWVEMVPKYGSDFVDAIIPF